MEEIVIPALHPLKPMLWGEAALHYLNVPTIVGDYMLVPRDDDFDKAVEKLTAAGFTHSPWSYGLSADPESHPDAEKNQNMYKAVAEAFAEIDRNSVRLEFPDSQKHPERVVLVRRAYVHLGPPANGESSDSCVLVPGGGYYCPTARALLESFVRTLLDGSETGEWNTLLKVWAISYAYGYLETLQDSALDDCEDERVRSWFNKAIRRGEGGMDRTTVTKRVGRQDGMFKTTQRPPRIDV